MRDAYVEDEVLYFLADSISGTECSGPTILQEPRSMVRAVAELMREMK